MKFNCYENLNRKIFSSNSTNRLKKIIGISKNNKMLTKKKTGLVDTLDVGEVNTRSNINTV